MALGKCRPSKTRANGFGRNDSACQNIYSERAPCPFGKRRSSRPGGGRCREFSCYAWEGLHAIAGVSLLWSLGSRGGGLQLINQLKIEDGGHTVVHIAAPGAFRPAPPGFPRDTPAIALSPSHACGPCHEEFSAASQLRGPIMMTSNFNVFVL